MPPACIFAEKKYGERTRCHTNFCETPEIQFWRYEYHFRIRCSEIKWTDSSKWGICAFDCYLKNGLLTEASYIFNSIPLQFNLTLFHQDNLLSISTGF